MKATLGGTVSRETFTATKGTVALALYRAQLAGPRSDPRPVLLLVHGSSISALPTFDLTVPGAGDYSVMNAFAQYGFDVWALDCENYGRSARTLGTSDIATGADDIGAAITVIERETGAGSVNLFGESSGALRAALFAKCYPERVTNLILSAYTYTGKGSSILAKRAMVSNRATNSSSSYRRRHIR